MRKTVLSVLTALLLAVAFVGYGLAQLSTTPWQGIGRTLETPAGVAVSRAAKIAVEEGLYSSVEEAVQAIYALVADLSVSGTEYTGTATDEYFIGTFDLAGGQSAANATFTANSFTTSSLSNTGLAVQRQSGYAPATRIDAGFVVQQTNADGEVIATAPFSQFVAVADVNNLRTWVYIGTQGGTSPSTYNAPATTTVSVFARRNRTQFAGNVTGQTSGGGASDADLDALRTLIEANGLSIRQLQALVADLDESAVTEVVDATGRFTITGFALIENTPVEQALAGATFTSTVIAAQANQDDTGIAVRREQGIHDDFYLSLRTDATDASTEQSRVNQDQFQQTADINGYNVWVYRGSAQTPQDYMIPANQAVVVVAVRNIASFDGLLGQMPIEQIHTIFDPLTDTYALGILRDGQQVTDVDLLNEAGEDNVFLYLGTAITPQAEQGQIPGALRPQTDYDVVPQGTPFTHDAYAVQPTGTGLLVAAHVPDSTAVDPYQRGALSFDYQVDPNTFNGTLLEMNGQPLVVYTRTGLFWRYPVGATTRQQQDQRVVHWTDGHVEQYLLHAAGRGAQELSRSFTTVDDNVLLVVGHALADVNRPDQTIVLPSAGNLAEQEYTATDGSIAFRLRATANRMPGTGGAANMVTWTVFVAFTQVGYDVDVSLKATSRRTTTVQVPASTTDVAIASSNSGTGEITLHWDRSGITGAITNGIASNLPSAANSIRTVYGVPTTFNFPPVGTLYKKIVGVTGIEVGKAARSPKVLPAGRYDPIPTGVTVFNVTAGGQDYTSAPTVTIIAAAGGGGAGATARAIISTAGVVTRIESITPGDGYLRDPIVTFSGGGGRNATATATAQDGFGGAYTRSMTSHQDLEFRIGDTRLRLVPASTAEGQQLIGDVDGGWEAGSPDTLVASTDAAMSYAPGTRILTLMPPGIQDTYGVEVWFQWRNAVYPPVFRLGPSQNTFSNTAARDTYANANALWLGQYDGDRSLLIQVAGIYQRRNAGAWETSPANPGTFSTGSTGSALADTATVQIQLGSAGTARNVRIRENQTVRNMTLADIDAQRFYLLTRAGTANIHLLSRQVDVATQPLVRYDRTRYLQTTDSAAGYPTGTHLLITESDFTSLSPNAKSEFTYILVGQ